MMAITLTEAITELAFGRRIDAKKLAAERFAEAEEWGQHIREATRAALQAAASEGRDLEFYRLVTNPLLGAVAPPAEVALLFENLAKYKAAQVAEREAIGRARHKVLCDMREGPLETWGSFQGGRSERIPLPELRHLVFIDDTERDELCNRDTLGTWSAIGFPAEAFENWRNPDLKTIVTEQGDIAPSMITDKKLIRRCMQIVYKKAEDQSVAPLNVNEIVSPVLTLLLRDKKRATSTLIREVAGEHEFARQRPVQGTPRPKHLKPASELKI